MSYLIGYKLVRPDYYSLYANGPYDTPYLPGEIAHAQPGTLGVMYFDTLEHCMDYYSAYFASQPHAVKILQVEYDTTTAITPLSVSSLNGYRALDIYYGIKPGIHPRTCAPPSGTLASMCVRVLGEWKPN